MPPLLPPDILYPNGQILAVSLWVNKGAGPIEWDGVVTATVSGADGAILDGSNPAIKATVLDLTNSNPLTVAITDSSGNQITSFGGGTQYTEDVAHATPPIGTSVNLIRKDTPAGLVSTDGDNVEQRGTNFGSAYVTILDSGGSIISSFGGGTQYVEDIPAPADPTGTNLNLVRLDTLVGLVSADGDNVSARGTNKGELYVKHVDSIPITAASLPLPTGAATEATLALVKAKTDNLDVALSTRLSDSTFTGRINTLGQKTMANSTPVVIASDQSAIPISAASLPLPTGAATLAEQQTQTTSLQLIDDPVVTLGTTTYTEGTTKAFAVAGVRHDADSSLVNTDNELAPFQFDNLGRLKVNVLAGTITANQGGAWAVTANAGTNLNTSLLLLDSTFTGRINIQGQKTMSASTPVVLASDQSAIPVNQNGSWNVTVNNATQYQEDVASPVDPFGFANLYVRSDTPTTGLVSTNSDWVTPRGSNFGAQYVTLLDSSGNFVSVAGGTQYTEGIAAAADPIGTALNLVSITTPGNEVTSGQNVSARGTIKGELYVKHVDTIGVTQSGSWNFGITSGGPVQYTEDAIAAADPIGNAVNLVRKDTPAATVSNDGDNIAQRGSNFGAAYETLVAQDGQFFAPAPLNLGDGMSSSIGNTTILGSISLLQIGGGFSTMARARSVYNGMNDTGQGIAANALAAQLDDVAPSTVTENNFAPARMSSNRNLYTTLRDAAGNERGANINSTSELLVANVITDGVTPTIRATVKNFTNSKPLSVNLTDSNGDPWQIQQYAEDNPMNSTFKAGPSLALVRNDGHTGGITSLDGDAILPRANNFGDLYTHDTLLQTDIDSRINTLGQKTSAQSTPVVLPSDQKVQTQLVNDNGIPEVGLLDVFQLILDEIRAVRFGIQSLTEEDDLLEMARDARMDEAA